MKFQTIFLLLTTTVICLATHGITKNTGCKCVKVSSHFISPRRYQHIDIFPPSTFCRKVEIVITLKNMMKICVNPQTPWVKRVVGLLTEKSEVTTPPAEVTSTE
ncbi:interleukin-8-like [Carcharodon carcharias]|uniref:interleukin-8-like n=1 Tax=Carcharodon carcharias TaxID=13397 RepID=UPI001B7E674D|nr:interleukin-8-like [Carcharodon carcharias]